jgi:choice-of-anchor B domain-containing protein
MIKNILLVKAFLCFTLMLSAQFNKNLDFVSNLNYPQNCNDIWGYVSQDGTEYAILGTVTGTAIISLEAPESPREVLFIPGAFSTWRDMKNWGSFVYVTADQGLDGLLIIDMTGAPDNISYEFWKPEFNINGALGPLEKCHNLYIDENGYCYLAGCNLNGGGNIILDVHSTPGQPIYVGATDPRYSHDSYARDNVLYSSDILSGSFSVIDVADKANPVTLATQETSFRFTHNAWLSDDGNYLYTTDERNNAFVDAYDISDLENIRLVDRIRPLATENTGVIPHNVHYFDSYLVISWYTDGVVVIDASEPDHLIEVGSYDTYLDAAGGFNGCWGAYPWLPSGLLLASDINTGLYVIRPNYVRAARLKGIVSDASTGAILRGARVEINASQANYDISDVFGVYRTGIAESGIFEVTASMAGYYPKTLNASIENGIITILDFELDPIPTFVFSVLAIDDEEESGIEDTQMYIRSAAGIDYEISDKNGLTVFNIPAGEVEIIAGKWGYEYGTYYVENFSAESNIEFRLKKKFRDDFVFDYGWEVSGDALRGQWERGVPEATFLGNSPSNPGNAYPDALGENCYVTGAQGGQVGDHDLDDGFSYLYSPFMDLTSYEKPVLQYARWFFNAGGMGTPNDTLIVYITNGAELVEIERIPNSTNGWALSPEFDLREIIAITESMQVIFEASDLPGSGHLVEAAVDYFNVYDAGSNSLAENHSSNEWSIYPNPTSGSLIIAMEEALGAGWFHIYNSEGRLIRTIEVQGGKSNQHLNLDYHSGLYIVRFTTLNGESGASQKIQLIR